MRFSTEEPEEHPEELLDLASAGQLGEADWKIVRAHLSHCEPCALQLAYAVRASQDASSRQSDDALERRAIGRVEARLSADRRVDAKPRPRRWLTLAFGALLLSGTAAAATWLSVRATNGTRTTRPAEKRVGETEAAEVMRRLPIATHAENASPAPAAAIAESAAAPPGGGRGVTRGDGARGSELLPDRTVSAGARSEGSSASVLFERAREFRLRGDVGAAVATYRRLQSQHGHSREGQLSYLSLARLYMETGRPALGAAQFTTYLSTGGSAWQEALVGRAAAFARLGRASEEAADWRSLLSREPASIYATRARARLVALERADFRKTRGAAGP